MGIVTVRFTDKSKEIILMVLISLVCTKHLFYTCKIQNKERYFIL